MKLTDMDPIDRAVMLVSTGLIFLSVVVLGIVEIIAGEPYGAAPVERTNEAGEVVNTIYPAVDPAIRTGLVVLALVILLLWAVYKMMVPVPREERRTTAESTT